MTRRFILIAILVAALLMVAAPLLAGADPNLSFELDNDNNGKPDNWIVRGAAYRICYPTQFSAPHGNCLMVFPPSNQRAVVYGRYNSLFNIGTEEIGAILTTGTEARAEGLPGGRIAHGVMFRYPDRPNVSVYAYLPAGTYGWDNFSIGTTRNFPLTDDVLYGYVAHAGKGRAAVDAFVSIFLPSP